MTRRGPRRAAALAVGIVALCAFPRAQTGLTIDQQKYRPGRPNLDDVPIETLPVQGAVYLIAAGKNANIVAQVDDQGVLLVDTGRTETSGDVLAQVRKLSAATIKAIINTTMEPDHIGGNERLALTGTSLYSLSFTDAPQAQIFAHEKALRQISTPTGRPSAVPHGMWPTDTFAGEKLKIFFNHEAIELLHATGHTGGDTIVWFRRSDVIAAGDVYSTTSYPRFDRARGGSLQGTLDALNRIVDIAVAEFNQQGGTRIVPGHGRISNQSDVVEYRDMATIVRDRVRDAIKAGRTLEQIRAMKVTLEYDGLYATPDYTGEMFVEAVYNDLRQPALPHK
jgi:glyoxylase-like metal-dependent hydrolase (beta-lactamase superfamily II)